MCPGQRHPSHHEQGGPIVARKGHVANVDPGEGQVKDPRRRVREWAGAPTRGSLGHTGPVSSRIVAVLTLLGLVTAILLSVRLLPLDAMLISGQ
jgi:hypothetical protein